ncbi:HSP90 family protein [Hazenella coriacea]|uniref:Molecular chaperone HtpG n=1 Tax=Hazenella coriacea TaxID=1179467 RepID=A0A4R3L650_9BACL|nr:HSP90 family protein [Hazenella coriacea]TCS93664.1 molecular chaperone HtpG [Hazenella coriacea]
MRDFHFKVNLKGMIDLLSNHLYSTPHVYIRELIQNGVDAITARKNIEPGYEGQIVLEVYSSSDQLPTLFIEDNGIGLTEEEVHQFLSQIGQTSKRGENHEDFIGRFGVGLLSCFIVSDEIVVITRSVKSNEAVEWRGKPDGSYSIRKLDSEMTPGTRIYLQSKKGFERYFEPEKVQEIASYYGGYLPYPLLFQGEEMVRLNAVQAPWDLEPAEALDYGRTTWSHNYLDAIPLYSALGEAKGIAYVLPHAVSVNAKKMHRVYVKQMLLSEKVEKILPDWAFFVTCVLNVNQLKPTASREEFYDDQLLDLVRNELGNGIKQYLVGLAQSNPNLLKEIIRIHYSSIKSLAIEDDELFRLFIDWLPFETTLGRMTMGEIRERSKTIYYTATLDEFRQMNKVAKAQSFCVINGGYVYDTELVIKLGQVFPQVTVERIDPISMTQSFVDLDFTEREEVYEFIRMANLVLQPLQCSCEVKKFKPYDLPAIYTTNEEALFIRSAKRASEETNELFASIIDQLTTSSFHPEYAQLCFNYENPLVQKVIQTDDLQLKKCTIEMLYVQSLLLGHHPLRKQEMKLLNSGLIELIDLGLR